MNHAHEEYYFQASQPAGLSLRHANGCLVFDICPREQYVSETDVCPAPTEPSVSAPATVEIVPILRRRSASQDRRLEGYPPPVRGFDLGLRAIEALIVPLLTFIIGQSSTFSQQTSRNQPIDFRARKRPRQVFPNSGCAQEAYLVLQWARLSGGYRVRLVHWCEHSGGLDGSRPESSTEGRQLDRYGRWAARLSRGAVFGAVT